HRVRSSRFPWSETRIKRVQPAGSRPDSRPPLLELLTQVEHYNWAAIVATAVVIAVVATGTVIAFRRYRSSDTINGAHCRMFVALGSLGAVMTIAMALLFVAAVVAVVDPGEALLGVVGL
ncbi:hypothetical protein, partial [Rhodococcus sp. (in: high G+C Gram-positive bacteria)]|uniref:hypothetical protein n=2 Tax=Rhodococcus sp. TaxID=1831 RepID=UPI003315EEC0